VNRNVSDEDRALSEVWRTSVVSAFSFFLHTKHNVLHRPTVQDRRSGQDLHIFKQGLDELQIGTICMKICKGMN
jgi:hypothetical protein